MDDSYFNERLERLREVLEARFTAEAEARSLAYSELQRRLDELNHAHANMVADRTRFVLTEVSERNWQEINSKMVEVQRVQTELLLKKLDGREHERFYDEYKSWRDRVNDQLSNYAGRTAVIVFLVGVLVTLILKFWK